MATRPAATHTRPATTWTPTPAKKSGEVDGITMPATTVLSGILWRGLGLRRLSHLLHRFLKPLSSSSQSSLRRLPCEAAELFRGDRGRTGGGASGVQAPPVRNPCSTLSPARLR